MKRDEACMWRRVSLKNYRSIDSADVVLAPFTVVVGPNGSGKSNFVDALALASELEDSDAKAAIEKRGGIRSVRRWGVPDSEETRVTVEVGEQSDPARSLRLRQAFSMLPDREWGWRFEHEEYVRFLDGKEVERLERKADGIVLTGAPLSPSAEDPPLLPDMSLAFGVRQSFFPVGLVHYLRPDLAKVRTPQRASTNLQLASDASNLAAVLEVLLAREEESSFITLAMRRLVPGLERLMVGEVSRFSIVEFEQAQAEGTARFSAADMSEGALRALCIIVASRMLRPWDLLIVEEPEVSIHPDAAAVLYDVLKLASGKGGAVLVTSHSPEFLDAARDEQILVCRYRKGATHIGPLASEQRQVVRDGLFRLSELMRSEPLRVEGEEPEAFDPSDSTP